MIQAEIMTVSKAAERLVAVLALILLNAFFVAAEFSIVAVRQSRISQLVQQGDINARSVQRLQQRMERLLSTTQIGITLSSLALGWIGESTIGGVVAWGLSYLPMGYRWTQSELQSISLPLAFLLVAYWQIVLGELCPKALALLYPEQMARALGPFSWSIARSFQPLISLLNHSTRCLLRLGGIRYGAAEFPGRLSTAELQFIIRTQSPTDLEAEAQQLLSNVFDFSAIAVGDVMVPRSQLLTLPETLTLADLLQAVQTTGYRSYPVVADSVDQVLGIIQLKLLAEPLLQGTLGLQDSLLPWIQPVQFVPEQMLLQELHILMQKLQAEAVIVVDEYGGTAGLVTQADIVNEILDHPLGSEAIQSDPRFQQIDAATYQLQAQMEVREVNERLDIRLPLSMDYTTLGGFLIDLLQQVPEPGQVAVYEDLELKVLSSEGPRLNFIQIRRLEPWERLTTPGSARSPQTEPPRSRTRPE